MCVYLYATAAAADAVVVVAAVVRPPFVHRVESCCCRCCRADTCVRLFFVVAPLRLPYVGFQTGFPDGTDDDDHDRHHACNTHAARCVDRNHNID